MADIDKRVRTLWSAMSQDGKYSGSVESFNDQFFQSGKRGYEFRYGIYKQFKDAGADVGKDYHDFSKRFGLHATSPKASSGSIYDRVNKRINDARQTVAGVDPTSGAVPVANAVKAMQNDRPMTDAERRQAEIEVQGMIDNVDNMRQHWENQKNYLEQRKGLKMQPTSDVVLGRNPNVVKQKRFNPETGKIEDTYLTSSGNVYANRFEADREQDATDDFMDRQLNPIEAELRDAYAERDRLEEMMKNRNQELGATAYGTYYGGAAGMNATEDKEWEQLSAAYNKNKALITTLEDKRNNAMNDYFHTLGNEITNGYNFTLGLADAIDSNAIAQAQKHIDSINKKRENGEKLTHEEEVAEAVLKNMAWDNDVQARYGDEYGMWADAAKMTATSADLMAEFLLTGGMPLSLARSVMNGVVKGGVKLLGKGATKGLGKYMLKTTGATLGSMVAGAEMANTVGVGRTGNDIVKRYTGDVLTDENGNYVLGHYDENNNIVAGGDTLLDAVLSAERQGISEYGSEVAGGLFPNGGKLLTKGLEKIGLDKLSKFLTTVSGKEWYKAYSKALETLGFNGVAGEGLEEYAGTAFDAMMGGDEWKNLADPKTHINIWLGCLTMSAFMNAPRATATAYQYGRYKAATNKSDKVAERQLGEEWQNIRSRIDNTKNEDMASVVYDVLNNNELAKEQKTAVMDYIKNLQQLRGFTLGEAAVERGGEEKAPEEQSVDQSYTQGYNAESNEDKQDVKNDLDDKADALLQFADESTLNALDEDGIGTLKEIMARDDWSDEQKQAALDYVNAKATYEGMIDRVKDDIETEVADSDAAIDRRVASQEQGGDGMIHPATMAKDNRQVDIISGNVVMSDDGSMVDTQKSDKDIIVRDRQTGKVEFANPKEIKSVEAPIDAEALKASERERITNERAQAASNAIDGVLPMQQGDQYTLTYNGEQHQVQVVQDNGDGTVSVIIDGAKEPQDMAKEQLQDLANQSNRARLEQSRQQTQQQAPVEETPTETPTTTTAEIQETTPEEAPTEVAPEEAPKLEGNGLRKDMPMREDGNPAFMEVTPERTQQFLYGEESGMTEDEATQFVDKNIAAAEKALDEVKKGAPEVGTDFAKFKAEKAAYQQQLDAAQAAVDYWNNVKAARQAAMAAPVAQQAPVEQNAPEAVQPSEVESNATPIETTQETAPEASVESAEEKPTTRLKGSGLKSKEQIAEVQKKKEEQKAAEQKKEEEKKAKRQEKFRKRAESWSKKTGVKVNIIDNVDDVENAEAKAAIKKGRKVKGWWQQSNNEIYIYLPNMESMDDVDETFIHEAVAHRGLRHLLGEEEFGKLCDKVFDAMSPKAKARELKYVGVSEKDIKEGKYTDKQKRAAADEYMAAVSEHTDLNPTLWEQICNWIREALGRTIDVDKVKMSNESIQRLIRASYAHYQAEAKKAAANEEVSTMGEAADALGDTVDVGATRFNMQTEETLQKNIQEWVDSGKAKKEGWTKEKVSEIVSETADLIRAIHNALSGDDFYKEWSERNPSVRVDWRDGVEKPTVTWTRGNIEYKYDMSADLLCINNEGLESVLASPTMVELMMQMQKSTDFTSEDYLTLYETLRDLGFVVPCKGCFDAAARLKMLPSVSQKFVDLVNKTIDERNKDVKAFDNKLKEKAKKAGNALPNGLPNSASNKEDAVAIGVAGDNLTEHITWTQLMSAKGQTKALYDWGGIFRAWQKTGAGRPKDKLLPEPYRGDIISPTSTIIASYGSKTPSYNKEDVNVGTGLRRNSHAEFRPLLGVDEIQFMRDAYLHNLMVFKYMKELDDVRLFGQLGVKFNMSFFPAFVKGAPAAGLDADGNYIASEESVGSREFEYKDENGKTHYDGMKGFEEAQKYINENVSLSSVVFSIPHLIKAFTDVPTRFDWRGIWGSLIPFHASGATAASLAIQGLGRARALGVGHPFSEAFTDYDKGVTNFEDVQNDRFGEGWVVVSGKKAGNAVEAGHKIEFANGTHYYNKELGLHLFSTFYIYDNEIPESITDSKGEKVQVLDKDGNIIESTKVKGELKKIAHPFYIDYNDKVREIGTDYAYDEAATELVNTLRSLGLVPRFDFNVPEDVFLKMCEDANVDPKDPKLGWKGEGNGWSPVDSPAYYSLWCDYGMTDPATGKYSPHRPVGYIDENGERSFRMPDNTIDILREGVARYSTRKKTEDSRVNEAINEFAKRSVERGKISKKDADRIIKEGKEAETRFREGKDEQETEKIFDTAKSLFGTTNDIREAGYVLPDGSMLDFSGRHLMDEGSDTSGLTGRRTTDHREIASIAYEKDGWTKTGVKTDMPDFIERGAIRIDDNAGTINLAVKPTKEQRDIIRRLVQRNDGDVTVDFGNGWDNDHSVDYEGAKAPRVLSDIDKYFDEGIRPQSDVRFREGDTFYSPAERAVENIKQEKATGEQWIKMLEKNGGLKKEEDKWMGLSDFLKDKKSLTKQEVLDFIRENQVEVQDVEYNEAVDLDNNPQMQKFRNEFNELVSKYETEKADIEKEAEGAKFRIVDDPKEIERLEKGEKETGYRNVVLNDDGSFGSPMANTLGSAGKKAEKTNTFMENKWEVADERPWLADENGKINLGKPDGLGSVQKVDYNPYVHIRPNKVNTQFKNAWERRNLVYIEVKYPASELTSGYHAEKAKLSVGKHPWNGGELILSRYNKPVGVCSWEEVADDWEKEFKGKGAHFDIVPPMLLPILKERGIKILPPHKNMSKECNDAYKAWESGDMEGYEAAIRASERKRGIKSEDNNRFRITPEEDAAYMDAVEKDDMETAEKMVDKVAEEAGYTIRGEHGTTHKFTIFNYDFANIENSFGKGHYFTNNEDDAEKNYASGEGADLTNRIENMVEQMEWQDGYEDMSYEERKEEARKILSGGENIVISAALKMKNPVVFGYDPEEKYKETFFDLNEPYDEESDEYGEPQGMLVDFVDALNEELYSGDYYDAQRVDVNELYDGSDGYTADQLKKKCDELLQDVTDEEGNMASSEIFKNALLRMGFDGIIDNAPSLRFNNMGLGRDTKHFIVFDSNQIKQTDPVTYDNNGKLIPLSERFNEGNDDIRFRVSDERRRREYAERQWKRAHNKAANAEYMGAVEKGDSKKIVSLLKKAAKAAMPNTKAADKRGIPIVLYHGTRSYVTKPFTIFQATDYGTFTSKDKGTAGWFADNYNVTPLGKIKNPFTMDDSSSYEDVLRFYKDMFDKKKAKIVHEGNYYRLEDDGSSSPMGKTEEDVKRYLIKEIDSEIENSDLERYNNLIGYEYPARPLYRVFLNMENPLIVDAKGADYAEIEYDGKEWTAEELGKYAKDNGYDGLIIKNNKETTSYGERSTSDTYMVFNPNQIKSADPITYDDNGKVIPLSERFNEGNDDIRFRVSDERRRREYAERQWKRAHNKAANTIKSLGISDNVTVVDTPEELAGYDSMTEQQKASKGWYDDNTGNIVVVVGNHTSPEDVQRTILREGVARYGLRQLFGQNYNNFLDNVLTNAETDIRREIVNIATRNGYDFRKATEEYLARLANDTDFERAMKQGWWSQIKSYFLDMLHSIGLADWIEEDLSDNELRYMLWRSYMNLTEPNARRNPFNRAKEISMRDNLKVGDYSNIEDELPVGNFDYVAEQRIRKLVSEMPMSEVRKAYERINDKMRDEDGLDIDEHMEKVREDWRNEHGSNGIGKVMADDVQMLRDKYGDGLLTLRNYLRDRIENDGETRFRLDEDEKDKPISLFGRDWYGEDVTLNDYYEGTEARFEPLVTSTSGDVDAEWDRLKAEHPDWELHESPKSTSEYLIDRNSGDIYRKSDHWGEVATCSWKLNHVNQGAFAIGKANIKDFKRRDEHLKWYNYANERNQKREFDDANEETRFNLDEDAEDTEESSEGSENSEENEEPLEAIDYNAGDMTLEEAATNALIRLAKQNERSLSLRIRAMHSIGGNLTKLRRAMAQQRKYDRKTVDSIVRLARMLMNTGDLNNFTRGEVKKLMSMVNRAAGKEDITKQADAVVDMMINHQLKAMEEMLHKQMKVKGSKLNQKGVEVQGALDITGQRTLAAFKDGIKIDYDTLQQRIEEAAEKMTSDNQVDADNARAKWTGYLLAERYHENILVSETEESNLRQELKQAKEDLDAGRMTREAYNEFVKTTQNAIRENRLERIKSYEDMLDNLTGNLREAVARAKEWQEKEQQRVEEIHHNANSDLMGVPDDEHSKPTWREKLANNSVLRFFMKPLANFDQILRFFGSKSVNGQGYLWNRFMGGFMKATDTEWRNLHAAHQRLDEKVSEVFDRDMRWSDLFAMERKMPTVEVEFWDGGEMKTHKLTQGNLLYIYMVNKMSDGQMKLRKMGITEDVMNEITERIDPRFKEIADWVQSEFLTEKRNEYNKVHERMFGASMASIDNYFPLKINSRSRFTDEEIGEASYTETRPSTITGSIVKRTRNSLALDITGADAFDVVLEHLQQMEHWAAFAEFSRDLNTLLSYRKFRNKVLNMSSVRFGSGKTLWNNFKDACAVAAGVYQPKGNRDSVDSTLVNVAKGVTGAKISLRVYTALKQFLSYPAYFSEASVSELAKSSNPYGAYKAWQWAMENLPTFAQRWQSRQAGDQRLKETDLDWGWWKNKVVEKLSRMGMKPNAFVDAITVSMGAKAIYETKKKRYISDGYSEEQAHERALRDAAIAFNETQQSSENAFLSAMQLDRTATSVALTVFRNSSMGYNRRFFSALDNLKRKMRKGYREESIAFMQKQLMRDGLSEEQAARTAKRMYNRSWYEDITNTLIFGFVMQAAWNIAPYLPYLIGGDDDDLKEKMLEDTMLHALAGGVEGLTAGSVISDLYNKWRSDEDLSNYNFNLLPLMSDIQTALNHYQYDKVAAVNDVFNLLVQAGIGTNPQTITDAAVAILDACDGEPETSREAAMLIMRILQVPQSAIDNLYIDELGMSADKAQQLTISEMARRYAEYKRSKSKPLTGWISSDMQKMNEEDKYIKRFGKRIAERMAKMSDEDLQRNFDEFPEDRERRKLAGKEIAKRAGGSDTYGNPQTAYGVVYAETRNYTDLAEDVLLQTEQKKAKQNGETEREKDINKARNRINKLKESLPETPFTLEDGTKVTKEDIMNEIRELRSEYLKEFGIKK